MTRQTLTSVTGVLLTSLVLVGGVSAAVKVDFPATLKAQHANVVQDNFLGISWELASFDTLCESTLSLFRASIRGRTTYPQCPMSNVQRLNINTSRFVS